MSGETCDQPSNHSTSDPLFSHNKPPTSLPSEVSEVTRSAESLIRWPGRKGTPSRPKWTPDKLQNLGPSAIYHESSRTPLKLEVVGSACVLCVLCVVGTVCCCVCCCSFCSCSCSCSRFCSCSCSCSRIGVNTSEKKDKKKETYNRLKQDENSVGKYKNAVNNGKLSKYGLCFWHDMVYHKPNKRPKTVIFPDALFSYTSLEILAGSVRGRGNGLRAKHPW